MRLRRCLAAFRNLSFLFVISVFGAPWLSAQTTWYASNAGGMAFEEIPSFRIRDLDYVLEISRTAGGEQRRLLNPAGEELKAWRITRHVSGSVAVFESYEKGLLVSVERYRPDGWTESIEEFSAGELSSRTVWTVQGGKLQRALSSDASGATLYEDSYSYSPSGALRSVVRTHADGRKETTGASFAGARPLSLRYDAGPLTRVERYDSEGKRLSLESWKGSDLIFSQTTAPGEDGAGLEVIQDAERGVRVERELDRSGNIKEERSIKDGATLSRSSYAYDEEGNVSRKSTFTAGRRERVEYRWLGKGDIAEESWYLNDRLWKHVSYIPPNAREEEIIRDGQVIMRVRYEQGRKIWEETVREGKIIRRREIR